MTKRSVLPHHQTGVLNCTTVTCSLHKCIYYAKNYNSPFTCSLLPWVYRSRKITHCVVRTPLRLISLRGALQQKFRR